MVRTSIFLVTLATATTVFAAPPTCSLTQKCPTDTPCCSQYGQCGVGAYCLGGCDPRSSFSLDSCVPEPVCKSGTYTFPNLDRVAPNTKYLGDASKADWVSSGQPIAYQNNVLLTMAPDTVGTLLASTSYMWYGNVQAKFKTSRGQGVVTAFILLSDVKDEIDYEFVGADLDTAQTNYYFQGITDYNNGANISLSDTFSNYHTYEIDWTPDTITWKVDGQVGRVKKRSDTWNATSNQWMYPQTPSRVQLSLWPAGLSSNGQGTINWAGGLVDWNSADIKNNGYYYASFESVTISCYNGTSAPGTNKGTSYYYNGYSGTNDTVVDSQNATVLASFQGNGLNLQAGAPVSGTGTAASSSPTPTAESIPGLSGGDPGNNNHNSDSSASVVPNSGSSPTISGSGSGSSSTGTSSSGSGFSQGGSSSSSSTKSGADKLGPGQEKVLKGSLLAGIIAVVAVMAL